MLLLSPHGSPAMHRGCMAALCAGPAVAAAVEPAMVSAVTSVATRARMRRVNMVVSVPVTAGSLRPGDPRLRYPRPLRAGADLRICHRGNAGGRNAYRVGNLPYNTANGSAFTDAAATAR
jgi:hypothetical protein